MILCSKRIKKLKEDIKSGEIIKRSNYLSEVDREYRTYFKIDDNKDKKQKE